MKFKVIIVFLLLLASSSFAVTDVTPPNNPIDQNAAFQIQQQQALISIQANVSQLGTQITELESKMLTKDDAENLKTGVSEAMKEYNKSIISMVAITLIVFLILFYLMLFLSKAKRWLWLAEQENKGISGLVQKSLFAKILIILAVIIIVFAVITNINNAVDAMFTVLKIVIAIGIIFFVAKGLLSYFAPKPYSPTEDFKTKIIRSGKQRKPDNVKRLYLRGEDMLVYSKWFNIEGILLDRKSVV